MSGTKSYQKHLQESASVEGEGWGAKFKASADFKKQESTDSSQRTVTVMSDAFCEVYSAKLMLASGPKLSDHFIAAVAGLPDAYDKDMYYHFIKDWGTHFVGYMLMGGRYGKHHYFTESGFAQMESHDLNIKAAASVSAFGFSGSASASRATAEEQKRSFEEKRTSDDAYSIGGEFSNNTSVWMARVRDNPMPVHIELKEIVSVFDTEYGMPESSAAKKGNMVKAMEEYCTNYKDMNYDMISNCYEPEDDPRLHLPILSKYVYTMKKYDGPPGHFWKDRQYHYLKKHDVSCEPSEGNFAVARPVGALNSFLLVSPPPPPPSSPSSSPPKKRVNFAYRCVKPTVEELSAAEKKTTVPNDYGNDYRYLDRHNVNCGEGTVLSQFKLVKLEDQVHYDFTCRDWPKLDQSMCRTLTTLLNADGSPEPGGTDWWVENEPGSYETDYHYLDRHHVSLRGSRGAAAIQTIDLLRRGQDSVRVQVLRPFDGGSDGGEHFFLPQMSPPQETVNYIWTGTGSAPHRLAPE